MTDAGGRSGVKLRPVPEKSKRREGRFSRLDLLARERGPRGSAGVAPMHHCEAVQLTNPMSSVAVLSVKGGGSTPIC